MSKINTQSMPHHQFLLVAANLLHRALIEAGRTDAKQLYRRLAEGEQMGLANVRLEDDSTASFRVSLDHTEFRGRINFGAFRASLNTLIGNIGQAIKEEKDVQVFSAHEGGQSMIFGITAVTIEQEKTNVLVLSADPGAAGSTELRLMYLDPQQFEEQHDRPDEAAV